jgi:hypothetical protein
MRALLVFLVSALVLLESLLPSTTAQSSSQLPTSQCQCSKRSCCVNRAAPSSAPLAATPARTLTTKPLCWLLAATTFASNLSAWEPTKAFAGPLSRPVSDRSALYLLNCAYLL